MIGLLLLFMAAFALLWIPFLVFFWGCAPNAETRFGYNLARRVSVSLAIPSTAVVVILIGVPGIR